LACFAGAICCKRVLYISAQEKIIEKYDITREYLWTPMSKLEQQLVSILHFCLPNALFFLLAKE
jgi:hypothetical protein